MSQVDIIQKAQNIAHIAMKKMEYAIKMAQMADKPDTLLNLKEYYINKATNAKNEFESLMGNIKQLLEKAENMNTEE